ncbi:MAG: hypothetical protein CSB48_13995 [Proteobacteria bacterium]|nr:MAG: hypothetical protein CSB48_13995 [Pseudomonadota bacterium]
MCPVIPQITRLEQAQPERRVSFNRIVVAREFQITTSCGCKMAGVFFGSGQIRAEMPYKQQKSTGAKRRNRPLEPGSGKIIQH